MNRKFPEILLVGHDYSIQEPLQPDCNRILLSPSESYLNDEIVQLEAVIQEIANRYNEHDVLLAYTAYVDACVKIGKWPKHYREFKKQPMFETNIRGLVNEPS